MKFSRVLVAAVLVVAVSTSVFAGKKDAQRIEALEARLEALEKTLDEKLIELEGLLDQKLEAAIQELAQREERAQQEFAAISRLAADGKQLEAKAKMDEFVKKYAGTDASKRAAALNRELSVVGKAAPADFNVAKWYVGEGASLDLTGEGTSLLVFWEEWCPHCRREVPKIQKTYEKYEGDGLKVIGLTKVTRSSTDEKVATFCENHKLSFPVIKEDGELSRYFNVSGIPAAAVVQDGKVIWRGHPGRLSEDVLKSWL